MELTQKLANWVVKSSYMDFPPETIEVTKGLLLKTITGMVVGSREPIGRIMTRYLKEQGGSPEVGVVCGRFRTTVENSALALGTFAHASELEDDQFPSAVGTYWVFPAFFSLGEKLVSSGAELVQAAIVGYEVTARLGLEVGDKSHLERGFVPCAWLGVIGVAAGAAKLLRLDPKQTVNAMSIAASHSASLLEQAGTDAHFIEAGHSCRAGILSALLAKEGATGQPDILERKKGLIDVVGLEKFNLSNITKGLGTPPFNVHRVWIKKFPCCFGLQPALDALSILMKEHKLKYDDVETVEVHANQSTMERCDHQADSLPNARFSFYHGLGEVLLRGTVDLSTFTTEGKLVDPKLKEAGAKVKCVHRSDWPDYFLGGGTTIVVIKKDGKKLEKHLDQSIGAPKYPLTNEQIVEINKQYTKDILAAAQRRRVEEIALNLEKQTDILELMDILTFGDGHRG